MKLFQVVLVALLFALPLHAVQNVSLNAPVKSVVAYSNGYSLVSRQGSVGLGVGEYSIRIENLTSSALDSSISFLDTAGTILSIARYKEDITKNRTRLLSFMELLNASLDKDVTVVLEQSQKSGKLAWYDGERVGILSGSALDFIALKDAKEVKTPAMDVNKTDEYNETAYGVSALVRSSVPATHNVQATYVASGVSWSEHYKLYLQKDDAKGDGLLQAWADVKNGADEDWNDVALTLVIGFPRIIEWLPNYYNYYDNYAQKAGMMMESAAPAAPDIGGAGVSLSAGYWTYTLPYPVSIKSGEASMRPLFSRNIPFKREFVWETWWSMPHRVYKLNNTGTESWGEGIVRLYTEGRFIGEDRIAFAPPGSEKEIYVADVPEIQVKKEVLNQTSKEDYNVRETKTKVELTVENKREEASEVIVRDYMGYADEVVLLSATQQPVQKPGNTLEWKVSLAKGEKKTITFEYALRDYYRKNTLAVKTDYTQGAAQQAQATP